MQNGKDCFKHCNEFYYIHDFEIVFRKSDDALLEYEVLDSELYLYNFMSKLQNFLVDQKFP